MAWDLNEKDAAWIAGIFEGEGSFLAYKGGGKTYKYLRVMIFNNDLTMLEEIQRLCQSGLLYKNEHKRNPKWKPSHQLQFGKKEDIKGFMDKIYPQMRTAYKRSQVLLAINKANSNGGDYI